VLGLLIVPDCCRLSHTGSVIESTECGHCRSMHVGDSLSAFSCSPLTSGSPILFPTFDRSLTPTQRRYCRWNGDGHRACSTVALRPKIMWRWGVMSFVTSLSLRGFQRRCALTVSVALSALLFALDRLPLLYQSVPDVPVGMAIRVVVLNTISGVAAGCAYARHSLEAAMTVHAAISAIDVGVAIG
jgi:hypothetical protein